MKNKKRNMKNKYNPLRNTFNQSKPNFLAYTPTIFVVKRKKTQLKFTAMKVKRFKLKTQPFKLKTQLFRLKTQPFKLKTQPFKLKTEPFKLKTEPFKLKTEPFKLKTEPFIFSKKKKMPKKVIAFKVKTCGTGYIRHFPPAAQEWRNSIYAYNKNYTKLLPAADNNFMNLVKSYFNFYLKKKTNKKTNKKFNKANAKHNISKRKRKISTRKRSISKGLSAKKIFLAKGDLKHTSSKAVITLYFYNTEKKFLVRNIKKQIFDLYMPNKSLKRRIIMDWAKMKETISYNRAFTVNEYLTKTKPHHNSDYLRSFKISFIEKLCKYFNLRKKFFNRISKLVETKVLSEDEKLSIFNRKVQGFYKIKYPNYQDYMHKVKLCYLKKLTLYLKLLALNRIKFKHAFLLKLKYLVSHIYNKNVEFNLVNLKRMHLNSDIFTQVVSLKLKNRHNKLHRVLKSSLARVKLRSISRMKEKYYVYSSLYSSNRQKQLFMDKISNFKINSLFPLLSPSSPAYLSNTAKQDITAKYFFINELLLKKSFVGKDKTAKDFFNVLLLNILPFFPAKLKFSYLNSYIFRYLRHRKLAGIRIEARGRLTKRFTASRSVFKLRWKGGLKNIDSSFRGLSAVILRGHVKSNVEYSKLHSKNRIGAFGLKGWVSSK